jgi:AraC family transcriptional regulator, ethanolamine operon transcriptional activator
VPHMLSDAVSPRQLRRQELVHRVRELVFEHPEQPLSVAELCTRLHVTRRTLQNGFQEALGTSPATYLRTVRLNAVRRALRTQGTEATIADTAARWGFWHMGHFSQDYKALFGETPSQTRVVG